MEREIDRAKRAADALYGGKSYITDDVKEIVKKIAKYPGGVIIQIPWDAEIEGEYLKEITVVAVKANKERVYFINPVKVSTQPCKIQEKDKKGPPRRIERDGTESIALMDLIKMAKQKQLFALIRET